MLNRKFDSVKQKSKFLPLGNLIKFWQLNLPILATSGASWQLLLPKSWLSWLTTFTKNCFDQKNGQDGVVDSATALSTLIGLHSSQFKTGFLEIPQMSYLIPTIAPSNKSLRCTRDSVFISASPEMTVRLVNSKLPRYGNPTYQLMGCLSPYRHPNSWWIFNHSSA